MFPYNCVFYKIHDNLCPKIKVTWISGNCFLIHLNSGWMCNGKKISLTYITFEPIYCQMWENVTDVE